MACSNNNQADPGVVRWVRSNPPSYYRMALLYFQALACSGDEQLSNTLRKTYVAVTVRSSTVVPGTKFTASKLRGWSWLKPNGLGTRPRSSIFTCTYNSYVAITLHERNLSKKRKHMAAPGPAIPSHLELAVQSTKVPREPTLITEK